MFVQGLHEHYCHSLGLNSQIQTHTTTADCYSVLTSVCLLLNYFYFPTYVSLPLPVSSEDKLWWQGKSAPALPAWQVLEQTSAKDNAPSTSIYYLPLMHHLQGLKNSNMQYLHILYISKEYFVTMNYPLWNDYFFVLCGSEQILHLISF